MMRRFTVILLSCLLLSACRRPSCILDVDVTSVEDCTCQVVDILQKDEVVDTVDILNGRCRVCLYDRKPSLLALRSNGEDIIMCFSDAERVHVGGDALKQNLKIEGSAVNSDFTLLRWEIRDVSNYIHQSSSSEESRDAHECYSKIMHRYFKKNRHNLLGAYFMTLFGSDFCWPHELVSLIDSLPEDVRDLKSVQVCRTRAQRKMSLESLPGNSYTDFQATDPDGQKRSLHSLVSSPKNRYVLLYFWASWDTSSFEELSKIRTLYDTYRSRGLEVFAVSCDIRKDKWLDALSSMKAGWVNVNACANGYGSDCMESYSVDSFPVSILIDTKTGAIVSSSFSGDDIIQKVTSLLK